jgi:hypothetical protein
MPKLQIVSENGYPHLSLGRLTAFQSSAPGFGIG